MAFRLDDIQDDYLYEAQRAVINVFTTKEEKCTVNIIGGIYFGGSGIGSMKQYVLDGINTGYIEAGNHSVDNDPITTAGGTGSVEAQQDKINECNETISSSLDGYTAVTFVPPQNIFDNNTLSAMTNLNMTCMSGQSTGVSDNDDPCISDGNDCLILTPKHVPVGAATYDWWTGNEWQGQSANVVFGEIETQLERTEGIFAAVMLHPQEHSNNGEGVNEEQIEQLELLIDMVKNAGHDIVFMKDIKQ